MRSDGLWFDPGGQHSEIWLTSAFVVEAEGRALGGCNWSLVLAWADRDGRKHRAVIRRADLAGDGTDVRQMLADRGLTLAGGRGARERLAQALAGVSCTSRVTLAETTGWRDRAFVLPHRTIAKAGQEPVVYLGREAGTHFAEKGSLAEWQDEVASSADGHHRLIFALALALTGPLLEPLGMEGGGFHFFGPSSCGKTTLLRLAGSVWGGGGELGFGLTWRTTDNALEGVAAGHNHTLLALDEIGQIDPKALGDAAYALANGQAKGRMRANTDLRVRARWRVPVMSSGEITLAERIREGGLGRKVRAGQETRIVDLPAEAGTGFGVFDHGGGHSSADPLARAIREQTARLYGTAGPAFVEALVSRPDMIEVARTLVRAITDRLAPKGCDGQIARVAARFALVAAAGEIAIECGILPYSVGTVADAVQRTYEAWLTRRGGAGRREDDVAIALVSEFLQRFGEARFAPWHGAAAKAEFGSLGFTSGRVIPDLAGWRRDGHFLINPATWNEITRGYDGRAVAAALAAAGYLERGSNGRNSQPVTVEGRKQRVYVIRASILEAGSDE
ncbi:MAG TPA: DUF927 domain-containing protein [Microvirga sp.]|jgi:uncharacterized protein (DUF927 family)|nr:DUF927 domain-containing protein [Microvirga sp.]